MRCANSSPSFWSGVAAKEYEFEILHDYSLWACELLKEGNDTLNIRILAGLDDEDDRFELRKWHNRVLLDLGYAEMSRRDALLAHLRGYAEEFVEGKRDFRDINRHFHMLNLELRDEILNEFDSLHYGFWDFEYLDLTRLGISCLEDFPAATVQASKVLLDRIDAEQAVPPKSDRASG